MSFIKCQGSDINVVKVLMRYKVIVWHLVMSVSK